MSNEKVHWEKSYAIGIKQIDDQYKKLFDLVNKLYDLEDNANIREDMKSIAYPALEEHTKIHEHIIDSLSQINTKYFSL